MCILVKMVRASIRIRLSVEATCDLKHLQPSDRSLLLPFSGSGLHLLPDGSNFFFVSIIDIHYVMFLLQVTKSPTFIRTI